MSVEEFKELCATAGVINENFAARDVDHCFF